MNDGERITALSTQFTNLSYSCIDQLKPYILMYCKKEYSSKDTDTVLRTSMELVESARNELKTSIDDVADRAAGLISSREHKDEELKKLLKEMLIEDFFNVVEGLTEVYLDGDTSKRVYDIIGRKKERILRWIDSDL